MQKIMRQSWENSIKTDGHMDRADFIESSDKAETGWGVEGVERGAKSCGHISDSDIV